MFRKPILFKMICLWSVHEKNVTTLLFHFVWCKCLHEPFFKEKIFLLTMRKIDRKKNWRKKVEVGTKSTLKTLTRWSNQPTNNSLCNLPQNYLPQKVSASKWIFLKHSIQNCDGFWRYIFNLWKTQVRFWFRDWNSLLYIQDM